MIEQDRPDVVVIRLTNWVGDCVMNTPFLTRARALFPSSKILCVGRAGVINLLKNHSAVDETWVINDKTLAGCQELVGKLRRLRPALGFLLPNSFKSALLFRGGNVGKTVGYARHGRRLLLTDPVTLRPEDLATHEVNYYLRLLRPWEKERIPAPPLHLEVTGEEREEMAGWLEKQGIGVDDFVVGVNPAALYGTAKRWLPERFAEAAAHFANQKGGRVVVTGLPTERDVAQAVCDAGGSAFINGAGEMSLRQLMAFLARADLYLTNDSGAMHIAAALGTPLIAIFGSTDWVTTAPIGDHCRIVRAGMPCAPCLLRDCPIDHRCMTGVSTAMVIDAAEGLLEAVGR
ncbi:MAG: lipopolysaccharide heptosyltransferase II [Candidatus Sumerlaeia bacterium]|nr:lipopolysaccharide heptosyltransferase II [Candidatus Sumerlaeia bacterium]